MVAQCLPTALRLKNLSSVSWPSQSTWICCFSKITLVYPSSHHTPPHYTLPSLFFFQLFSHIKNIHDSLLHRLFSYPKILFPPLFTWLIFKYVSHNFPIKGFNAQAIQMDPLSLTSFTLPHSSLFELQNYVHFLSLYFCNCSQYSAIEEALKRIC